MIQRLICTFAGLFALVSACGACHADGIPWGKSLDAAVAHGKSSGKPVLLYVHADYCVYCHQMDREAFVDSRAVLLADQFVPCAMDGEHDGKPLIKQYNIERYPFEVVVDGSGSVLSTAPDYMDPDKYTQVLATALPDSSIASLAADHAAHSTDPKFTATLVVVEAVKGDLPSAEKSMTELQAIPDVVGAFTVAAGHALGKAEADAGHLDKAVAYLQSAVAGLGDTYEAVQIHMLLADCLAKQSRPADALAEFTTVRKLRAASRDEKKLAEKRSKELRGK